MSDPKRAPQILHDNLDRLVSLMSSEDMAEGEAKITVGDHIFVLTLRVDPE